MDATNFLSPPRRSRAAERLARVGAGLGRIAASLDACMERSRQRRHLAELGEHLLKDIGLSRGEVARECGRWPWDGPPAPTLTGSKLRLIRRPFDR